MNTVFIDTGYLLALELSNDQNHQAAQRHWRGVASHLPPLVTTSYVFNEVVTFLNRCGHHTKAVQIGSSLLHSPSIHLIHVDDVLFFDGWSYFQQYQDKSYSLADCISFVVMQHHGITTAFAFDKHFAQAGFRKVP